MERAAAEPQRSRSCVPTYPPYHPHSHALHAQPPTATQLDRMERADAEPPRLGRERFEPMPLQVLTTDEAHEARGSLRRIKPTPALAKDRWVGDWLFFY